MVKQKIYNRIIESLDQKIEIAKEAISSAKESRDNDTKSSAGDKFETGREMMQIEIDKNEAQLSKAFHLKNDLSKINLLTTNTNVEFGSLVETNNGTYFMSIGIGKVEVDKKEYFAISLVSPIGQILYKKKIGDKAFFQKREFIIENIV